MESCRATVALAVMQFQNKSAINLALQSSIYAASGNNEKALDVLNQALAKGYGDFAEIDANPYYTQLRSDPRFQQLVQRSRKQ
jgi:hypothetical protein